MVYSTALNVAELPAERVISVATRLGRLHVRAIGEGRPTILWPSMFVDSHTWDRMIAVLPQGRRYLLVDPPGLGLSEPLRRDSDIAGAAEAAVDLLDGLGVDGPVDWLGNALGGHVGLKLAIRPGVLRSLVAVSSPAEAISAGLRRQINVLLPILRTVGPVGPVRRAVVAGLLTDACAAQPDIRRVVVESLNRPTRRSLAAAVRSFILARRDVTAELPRIGVPSLFVATDDRGDWSPEDASASAALTPGASVVVVVGARTLVPLERPQVLANHVRAFWDRIG
jgi:pimeloyl-ACP methyl ester carboxylesterase